MTVRGALGLICRLVLGGVFLYAGAVKVGRPLTAARAVQAYEIPGLTGEFGALLGQALPWIEIVLGLLLVLGLFTRTVSALATLLMLAFVVGIAAAWARGLTIDCGCFGGGGLVDADQTQYPLDIARDLALAAMGAWLWWRPSTPLSLDRRLFGAALPPAR